MGVIISQLKRPTTPAQWQLCKQTLKECPAHKDKHMRRYIKEQTGFDVPIRWVKETQRSFLRSPVMATIKQYESALQKYEEVAKRYE